MRGIFFIALQMYFTDEAYTTEETLRRSSNPA